LHIHMLLTHARIYTTVYTICRIYARPGAHVLT